MSKPKIFGAGGPSANSIAVSQDGVEVVYQGTPNTRISQIGIGVAYQGTPKARISQLGFDVIYQGTPKARISQTGLLIVYKKGSPLLLTSFDDGSTIVETV